MENIELTIAEFLKKDKGSYTLIDVREEYEYEEDNLGGILIPLGELQARMEEIPTDKDIIIHCRTGQRSSMACMLLSAEGYSHVFNLSGGIVAYHKYQDSHE